MLTTVTTENSDLGGFAFPSLYFSGFSKCSLKHLEIFNFDFQK